MAHQITNIQSTTKKAKTHQVRRSISGSWLVTSGSSGTTYRVRLEPLASCTCDWAKYRPQDQACGCSHVQAVVAFEAEIAGYSATIRSQAESTSHLHRKTEQIGDGIKVTLRKKAGQADEAPAAKAQPTGDQISDWFSY